MLIKYPCYFCKKELIQSLNFSFKFITTIEMLCIRQIYLMLELYKSLTNYQKFGIYLHVGKE